jgi:hypothetical protein
MENIEIIKSSIIRYLECPSAKYAALITGDWGSGKTFFLKNILIPLIKTKFANKKQIYISLNGVNKLEQVSQNIVIEYSKVKSHADTLNHKLDKLLTMGSNALSEALKSYAKIDLRPENFIDLIDFNDTIIFFDDLERQKIGIESILGFINDFIEHKQAKVIILANEKEIEEGFSEIKEKVIGKTFTFRPDMRKILLTIIEDYPNDLQLIFQEQLSLIEEVVEKIKSLNFRIIRSALDDFVFLYSELEKYEDLIHDVLHPLLKYTLAVALEIRL